MGRTIPLADDLSLSLQQALSFSFILAGMAAVIAISTTLCGVRFGRKTEEKSDDSASQKEQENVNSNDSTSSTAQQPSPGTGLPAGVESEDGKENEKKELPLPPSKQLRETFSYNNVLAKSASTRTLGKNMSMKMPRTMSMSMKMPRTMSMARRDRLDNLKKKPKMKHEDSVWMKTIILGEKCRVPDEDDTVIYDAKGNKITTYHPKTASSRPVSRQSSFNDVNLISSPEKEVTRKEEEEYS